jgi:hypothetical protein
VKLEVSGFTLTSVKVVNRAAICNMLKLYPRAQVNGVAAALRQYLFKLLDDPEAEWAEGFSEKKRRSELMEMYSDTFPPNIRPDLWEIDENKKLIRWFEIEDTNPLSDTKLSILLNWWWALDCEGVELELYVCDRYGLNLRKLDLAAFCFDQEFDLPPNSDLTHQIAGSVGVRFDSVGKGESPVDDSSFRQLLLGINDVRDD